MTGFGTDGRALWRVWLWPWGVAGVLLITLAWMVLPGGGGAGWLWLPLAFAFGVYVAWTSWAPGRRVFDP